ncbi:MAG: insulinase family protein, partial [Deltaproteobacteria bacterium]|nr:insulinase family protein [Nannocystaceae bacterium]
HLLEHAMFGGSAHVADGEHYEKLLRAGASGVGAFTTQSATVYHADIPANRLPLVLWLESDRMGTFNARTHRGTIEKERRIVVEEMAQRRRGDDYDVMSAVLQDLLYPEGHPLHSQDAGSLARIDVDDIDAFAERYYGPRNATLVIAGALPEDARALVARYFGGLEGGERPAAPPPETRLAASREARLRSGRAEAPMVWIAWPTPGFGEPGSAEGEVFARLVASRGLGMLERGSSIATLDCVHVRRVGQSTLFVVVGGTPGSDSATLLAELDGLITRIASGAPSDLDVLSAVRRSTVAMHAPIGAIDRRAELMAEYLAAGKPPDWLAQDVAEHRRTTKARLLDFVRASLRGRPRAVVYVSPTEGSR